MARRVRRTGFVRPAARTSLWLGVGIAQTAIGAGSTATLFGTLNAAALLLRPFTIIRTRLLLSIESDQQAATEFVQGAFAMQVVTETAAAAGIASLPTPLTEVDADYFVYQPFINSFILSSAVGIDGHQGSGSFWTVDSKAMRKVGPDDDVAMTTEGVGTNGFNIATEGRMLIKLH